MIDLSLSLSTELFAAPGCISTTVQSERYKLEKWGREGGTRFMSSYKSTQALPICRYGETSARDNEKREFNCAKTQVILMFGLEQLRERKRGSDKDHIGNVWSPWRALYMAH